MVEDRQEIHHYHHEDDKTRVNVSFEKNTKGYNFSATVTGAKTIEEAMAMLVAARDQLEQQFGEVKA